MPFRSAIQNLRQGLVLDPQQQVAKVQEAPPHRWPPSSLKLAFSAFLRERRHSIIPAVPELLVNITEDAGADQSGSRPGMQ